MSTKLVSHIIAFLCMCCVYSQNSVKVSNRPSWINYQNYTANPKIDENEISQGALTLLADYQTHIPKQEVYFRMVNKITDHAGVQANSNITAVFDPLYQQLTFHNINIIRDGEIINKLNREHFQVIRRELNAENHLYDGSLSAMLYLSDVRKGDIIDYSYTVKGFNPINKGKYADSFVLNDYVPIGKINVSINAKNALNYKTFNTDIAPKINKRNGYTQYNWTIETPEHFTYEENIPVWEIVMPTIFITEYHTWAEVAKWADDIYGRKETLNAAITTKVKEIDTKYKTQGEKIKAVLNFVQNDIRYLGLEYGISSYKPNSPNKVFEQRYGDCKDKSLLMVHMLKALDIKAYPMLLNTYLKGSITELPPSPSYFDHCVVKVVDKEEHELYYDPTISNQGGTYTNTHFPNYKYGLVVKKNNVTFDTITSISDNKVTTLETFVLKEINGGATLNVTTTYTDVEADRLRNYFKNTSKSNIVKEYENYYANYYSKVKMIDDPFIEDDIKTNEFKVHEAYTIDSIWKPIKLKPGYVAAEFAPSTLKDLLYLPNIENRKHEIGLTYPVSREHKIHVTLPSAWQIEPYNDVVSNDVFYYESSAEYGKTKKEIKLNYYLKIQKPSVTQIEFKTYTKAIKDLENSFGYSIYIPLNSDNQQTNVTFLGFGKFMFVLLLLTALIGFIVWFVSKKKQTT